MGKYTKLGSAYTSAIYAYSYDYKDFSRMFFEANYWEEVLEDKNKEEQIKYNWCERNLMFKDPLNNRFLFLWDIIFLVAFTI